MSQHRKRDIWWEEIQLAACIAAAVVALAVLCVGWLG